MPASIRDVAIEAGVSIATVSNTLNNPEMVSVATRQKVLDAVSKLGFVRNDAARVLRAGKSKAIGLIVLDGANPFFAALASGADEAANRLGYSVLVANSNQSQERERDFLNLFEEQRVAGVLISPLVVESESLRSLSERGTPVVLVDLPSADQSLPSVSVDDVAGGKLVVEHLISGGASRILFVGGPLIRGQIADRLAGATAAAESGKASLEVVETEAMTVEIGRRVGDALLARRAAERADAIFAANDLLALGLMQAFIVDGGVSIPKDIAIVGYDDIDYSSTAIVPLSSVRQSPELIGQKAIELLLAAEPRPTETWPTEAGAPEAESHFDHAPQIVLQPELVVRASSARSHAAS